MSNVRRHKQTLLVLHIVNKRIRIPRRHALRSVMREHLQVGGRGSVVGVATPRTVGQVPGGSRMAKPEHVTDSKRKPNGERLGAQRLPKLDRKNHVQAYVGGEFHLGADHQARPSFGGHHASVGVATHLAMAGRGVFPGSSIVSSSYRHSMQATPKRGQKSDA